MEARLNEQSRLLEQVGLSPPEHPREGQRYYDLASWASGLASEEFPAPFCLCFPLPYVQKCTRPPQLSSSLPISYTSHFPPCNLSLTRGGMLSPPNL